MRLLTAVLAASLAIAADGRAQVLPAGEFAARDGRPGAGQSWKLNDRQGAALAARVNAVAAKTPIVVDYDHQTLHAMTSGAMAPAAGWIKRVEWLAGQGLFATVEWTAKAKALIDAGEYRYFSPVIEFNQTTGEVNGVLMGALLNYPAILGMDAVQAALAAQFPAPTNRESPDMNLLAQLLARIGLPAETTEAAALSAVGELKAAADAAKARPAVPAALSGLLGLAATADEAAALAAVTALQGNAAAAAAASTSMASAMQQVAALQGQVNALVQAQAEGEITRLADEAIAAGKFVPAFRDELLKIGRGNKAALAGMVAAAPVIPGLAGQSTAAAAAAAQAHSQATAALSGAEALKVAAAMGIKPDAWAAALVPKAA